MADSIRLDADDTGREERTPVLLFDGVCNLCNDYVQFVLERDDAETIRFGSLQSEAGSDLLKGCGLPHDYTDSLVLVEGSEHYTRSSAVLRVCHHLGGPYRLLSVFRIVPKVVRDAVYEQVAARRYDWFGKKNQCMIPSPGVQSRFVDSNDDDQVG
jgi:predicted DCC family thiol-disulfide oxidoreductase YuxK